MRFHIGLCLVLLAPASLPAQSFLVRGGQAQAEILISPDPPRSTRLAAHELQHYVAKITGATLPIVMEPSLDVPHQVFVGDSPRLASLGISSEGLEDGAYRIVSGGSWLALVGDDADFVPREPWARNNSGIVSGQLQADWEAASGLPYGVPNGGMYKHRERMPAGLGLPADHEDSGEPEFLWNFDERGSFNAVCGFLRHLGVRWYLPGELGEIVPQRPDIELPEIDETVTPDFSIRQFNIRFGTASDESMRWAMRLGIRQPYGLMIAHGMHTMMRPEILKQRHPDWFADYGGRRDTASGKRLNHYCYSNPELFEATVAWARAQFDVYDYETVSIMPPDAYIAICQCHRCEGEEVPEMGARGKLSNHVWDFVNRVAREVRQTHPDKRIVCCAYGANTSPPTNLDKLEPNVQVVIVGGRRPRNNLPEQREPIRELRSGWKALTDNPLMVFENYPFTQRGWYLPAFVSKAQGESINATKGISRGEDIWLSWTRDFETDGIGFNHFQVYFTARMYWGGPEADVEALLEEYCDRFYGPAGEAMLAFFRYCEAQWQAMESDVEPVNEALALFDVALDAVAEESIQGRRLALVDEFLDELRSKADFLTQKRGPVPFLRTVWDPKEPIVIDGHLDDAYWKACPVAATGSLRELETGGRPIFGTRVMAGFNRAGTDLYLAIRCQERPGEALNIATEKREDQSIWYGDLIEILLATDAHSYYQVAVNPAGALVDLDRGVEKEAWFRWESQAEVATQVHDDHWIVEIRLPFTDDENDPLNQVIGRKPSSSLPWHLNVCRQRVRESGKELSAFSPTGTASFHEPMKFAHFYDGRSHRFEADPSVRDFLIDSRAAEGFARQKDFNRARDAYVAIGEAEGITERQHSVALARAVALSRQLDDPESAERWLAVMPPGALAKVARMEHHLANREAGALIEEFGEEALETWPFTEIGAGAFARGRAYASIEEGEKAESDFRLALEFTSDPRLRMSLLRSRGQNREFGLKDDPGALEIYSEMAESTGHRGSAEYFYGLEGAARILSRQGKTEESLAVLDHVDPDEAPGSWRGSLWLARARVLDEGGRKKEAIAAYEAVIAAPSVGDAQRRAAETRLEELR